MQTVDNDTKNERIPAYSTSSNVGKSLFSASSVDRIMTYEMLYADLLALFVSLSTVRRHLDYPMFLGNAKTKFK